MNDFVVTEIEPTEFKKTVYCIDCTHFSDKFNPDINKVLQTFTCNHPSHRLDLVTKSPRSINCKFERSLAGKCGPSGINYAPQ